MVYKINLECTTTVSDDAAGELKVYAMASKKFLDLNNTTNNITVRDHMKNAIDNNIEYVYLMGTVTAATDTPVDISGHVFKFIPTFENTSAANLDINVNYSVYVVAVDSNGNYSDVYTPDITNANRSYDHLRGKIDARPAPIISNTSGSFTIGGITLNATVTSDVYFDYYMATFDKEQTTEGLNTFFADTTVSTDLYTKVIKSTGNVDFLEKVTENITDISTSTNVILDITTPTNYSPFIDLSKSLYTYIYALNESPHSTFTSSFTQNVPTASKSLSASLVSFSQTNDTQIDASFNIDWIGTGSVEFTVALYDVEQLGFRTSGSIKNNILNVYTHNQTLTNPNTSLTLSFTEYRALPSGTITLVQNSESYYMYFVARDTVTGETTEFKVQELVYRPQTGIPLLRDASNLLVEQFSLERTAFTVQITNSITNYAIHYEAYELDVYIMLVEDDLLKSQNNLQNFALKTFMRNNTTLANDRLVYKTSASGSSPFNDFKGDLPFKFYQTSFDDVTKYAELNALSTGVTLCLYAERKDNNQVNSFYTTPIKSIDNVISIDASLSIVRELDTSFEIQCPQATSTDVHYVMAFAQEIIDQSLFNDFTFINNFKSSATSVNNTSNFTIDKYYTEAGVLSGSDAGTTIEHKGTYYIYAYALRTSTGVNDLEVLQGTAVHVPVISFVTVNFDQYDTSV
tara:strand:- start:1373 stop:3436 length:2064 start_codon:yes stop_codon:yes gene_type:complete